MANWDDIRSEWETTRITLAALAEKYDIKLGTLKSRKSREGWSRDPTKKDATKSGKVATIKQKDAIKKTQVAQRKRSGNLHPNNQFTKRNKAAEKHGLFSKFLPKETKEIMDAITDLSAADLIWQQIQSPAVEKKRWRHSGSKKNSPREAHVDLDGEEIDVDEMFGVNGHAADHPRDTSLPAGERVNCHCVLSPVVNKDILGLSKEEKEEMRRQVLEELNS
ncbi:phage minor head protein [Domibacillus robiginosus]|uniref:phage minor head protein n=1 Tax=Domibacillus robiginosus TaxID=1071054 RepID=UPI00067C4EED|nr:phage minor head protein [Domibacillus robiginosus]